MQVNEMSFIMDERYIDIYNLSRDVLNISSIVLDLCKEFPCSEDVLKILPIAELLYNKSDALNEIILDIEENFKNVR